MKICQLWGRAFVSLTQRYEETVPKFSFLARHHILKQNYIVIFGKHVKITLDYIHVFLDPPCIVNQEEFQHKILHWSTLPLLVPTFC